MLAERGGNDDGRSREKRLADALVELARGKQPAPLMVTVSAETLLAMRGAPGGEMEFAPPVVRETVERLRCDCTLQRVVMDDRSVVIDVGRGRRLVTGKMRRAPAVRDGGCRWPGCGRTASWCEAHHLEPWSRGGGSSVAGSVLLCSRHHWLVHEGRWTLAFAADGRAIKVKPPPRAWTWAQGPGVAA